MTRTSLHRLALAAVLALLAGCYDDGVRNQPDAAPPPPDAGLAEGIDILFVIDNSGTMSEEQESLATNFHRFVNVLNEIEGGLPNLHLGVVSTDVGAGPFGIQGCTGNGDNGDLQSQPADVCDGPSTQRFITDYQGDNGVARDTNYEGDLQSAFSCVAQLGTDGCGFEQPLESMRRALNGSSPVNQGFLRPDALLAVVIVTDEDDCSTEDLGMFDSDPSLDRVDSFLGSLSSFRCFEFGVQCSPDAPREAGARVECAPRANSPFMHEVDTYVRFLKSLKDDPRHVVVAGVIGAPTPVAVSYSDGEPGLIPSCSSSAGDAAPAIRLDAFLDGFPERNVKTTICNSDLSDALTAIAELISQVYRPI